MKVSYSVEFSFSADLSSLGFEPSQPLARLITNTGTTLYCLVMMVPYFCVNVLPRIIT